MRLAVATIVALLAFASPAFASPVANLTVVNANPSAGAGARTQYAVGFTTSATGGLSSAANSRINVTFPAGTAFSGYTSGTVRNAAAEDVGSCSNPTALTIQCSLFSGRSIGAGQAVSVVFSGITNPGTAGQQTLTVTTTADQDPASTQYTVVAANPITAVTVDNTNAVTGRRRAARSTSSASPPRPPAAACPAPPTAASTSPSPPAPPSPATSAPPYATSPPPPTSAAAATPVAS